ncbi:MAG: hypothetical protein HY703_03495 [Gemmatimonadetes bacterium]|nr:hypothetical protein [Gemmatimonadota bacterium]
MFREKRLALLLVGVMAILGAAAYGLARRQHTANPGPYAAVIERLHEINHQMREMHHSYRARHQGEEAFERWHELLHEERQLLHSLPGALEGVAPEQAGTQDTR